MPNVAQCPDAHSLQQWLLGLLPAESAEALERHVEQCGKCATSLQGLCVKDDLVSAVNGARFLEWQGDDRDVLVGLVRALNRFTPGTSVTKSLTARTPVHGGEQTAPISLLELLAPPQEAGELGRLGIYRIRSVLGSGGMGVVFLADDPRLCREVALKVIKPELASRPGFKERFLHEARSAAALEHDYIVPVWHADEDRGVTFIAMPVLRGGSLDERLRKAGGPLPIDEVLLVGRQIAEGLAAAHARSLIHRDIKPANIWLEEKGEPGASATGACRVKILDFGLAKARSDPQASATEGFAGTPSYMAPEQARGESVDGRADLFSLGCVLYRMIAARAPFEGDDALAVIIAIATDTPKPLAEYNPEAPPELCHLVMRMLAKRPEGRPASAREVADTIAEIEERRQPRPSRRRWLIGTAAAVLVACGVTAWLVAKHKKATPVPPPEKGLVTFDFEEPELELVLKRGEEELPARLRSGVVLKLDPADYMLRLAAEVKGRRLIPDRVVVKPGQKQTVKLALVGEIDRHMGHSQAVMGLGAHFRKDGWLVVSGSLDRQVGLWEMGEEKVRLLSHGNPVRCVAISSDGERLASAGGERRGEIDLRVHLWNTKTREPVGEPLAGHESLVLTVAFSPDGKQLLSGSADGVVLLWDIASRKSRPLEGHDGLGVTCVAFSPDGTRALSAGGDGQVIVWDVRKGEAIRKLAAHPEGASAVLFLPGGGFVSTGKDGCIRLWDDKSDKPRLFLKQEKAFQSLSVSADGGRLMAGDADGVIRVWEMPAGREVERLEGHRGPVNAVVLFPDGTRAFSAGSDQTVRYWQLPR